MGKPESLLGVIVGVSGEQGDSTGPPENNKTTRSRSLLVGVGNSGHRRQLQVDI